MPDLRVDNIPSIKKMQQAKELDDSVHKFSHATEQEQALLFGANPPQDLIMVGSQIMGPNDSYTLSGEEFYQAFGINVARETILIANQFYDLKSAQILEQTEENDKIVEKIRLISDFRMRLTQLRDANPKAAEITFLRQEDKDLVDKLAEISECKRLFTKGEYTFENGNGILDRRDRDLVEIAKSISTPHVNFNLMKMQECFNERNRVMEIVMEIVKQYNEGVRVFVQNLNRR